MFNEPESLPLSILLISPEYPPMPGGVGRYTHNLREKLVGMGFIVSVVCDKQGNGEYSGISQHNPGNSEVLLELVEKLKPDLVHVQYEPGLYDLKLDMLRPSKTSTNIDKFYKYCKIPIITTFHSAYPFKQWMSLPIPIYEHQQDPYLLKKAKRMMSFWTRLINYRRFQVLNEQKLAHSAAGIAFSEFTANLIGRGERGCHVIPHGAEKRELVSSQSKSQLRDLFSIPRDRRVALAIGYATKTKGWDIIEKMEIPDMWTIVMNASKNEYSHESYQTSENKKNLIGLHSEFLDEEELCALFSCADAVILPYKVSSGSGIMFDGLSYGLPFVASNLGFFNEFALLGLGITAKRTAIAFSEALLYLDKHYEEYSKRVAAIKNSISWQEVANKHAQLYRKFAKRKEQDLPYSLSTGGKMLFKSQRIGDTKQSNV